MRSPSALMVLTTLVIVAGCAETSPTEDGTIGATSEALTTLNGLATNGLATNGLASNGLGTNGLASNGLASNGLASNGLNSVILAAVQNSGAQGEAARSFIRHAISCSLEPSQAFDFTWVDAAGVTRQEHFVGELGLAPEWVTGPLGESGQRKVSACLASHVNYYGIPVIISLRSAIAPLRLHPLDEELNDYPNVEGAFWGNLWAEQPYINACYNGANIANSHSYLRDCATGHTNPDGTVEDCGIINVVGPCEDACVGFNQASQHYTRCVDQTGSRTLTDLVITTALP